MPTWDGELYFQYHRGVQTTQSERKRGNRKNEVLILNAEKLASIDTLFGAAYPQAGFDTSWEKILFNQFHDILPGSGIGINYVDAARKYAETSRFESTTSYVTVVACQTSPLTRRGSPMAWSVLVFNPLSWPRTEEVEVDGAVPDACGEVWRAWARGQKTGASGSSQHERDWPRQRASARGGCSR